MTWFPASTPPGPEIGDVLGATAAGYREVVHYHQSGVWMSSAGQIPIAWWCEIPAAPNPWLGAEAQPAERGDCTPEVAGSTPVGSTTPTDADFRRAARRNLKYRRRVPGVGNFRNTESK